MDSYSCINRSSLCINTWNTQNTRVTYMSILIIFLILLVLNVQFLFYNNTYRFRDEYEYNNENIYRIVDTDMDINVVQCSSENHEIYKEFYQHIWVYVDAFINVYLPFLLMFLCSTIIFLSVLRTMGNANNSNKRLVARSLSTMLLSINTMFVLLTGPIVIYLIYEKRTFSTGTYDCDIRVKAKYKMMKLFFIILMNANHTGNILVYCLTGTEFRTQLFYVLGRQQDFPEQNSLRHWSRTISKENQLQTSLRRQYYYSTSKYKQVDKDERNTEHIDNN